MSSHCCQHQTHPNHLDIRSKQQPRTKNPFKYAKTALRNDFKRPKTSRHSPRHTKTDAATLDHVAEAAGRRDQQVAATLQRHHLCAKVGTTIHDACAKLGAVDDLARFIVDLRRQLACRREHQRGGVLLTTTVVARGLLGRARLRCGREGKGTDVKHRDSIIEQGSRCSNGVKVIHGTEESQRVRHEKKYDAGQYLVDVGQDRHQEGSRLA